MRKKAFNIFTIFLRGAPKLKNRCVFEKFPFFKYSKDSNEPKKIRSDPVLTPFGDRSGFEIKMLENIFFEKTNQIQATF